MREAPVGLRAEAGYRNTCRHSTLGHHPQQFIGDRGRVAIKKSHPLYAGHLRYRIDKSGETVFEREVLAVGRRVLRDQHEFFHALRDEHLDFSKDRFRRTRAKTPRSFGMMQNAQV